jgi:alkylhydroperoxidase family enzyme
VRDVRASDEALAAVREHLSPREVVELLLVIGNYMLVARVAETAGIELDEAPGTDVADGAARRRRSE